MQKCTCDECKWRYGWLPSSPGQKQFLDQLTGPLANDLGLIHVGTKMLGVRGKRIQLGLHEETSSAGRSVVFMFSEELLTTLAAAFPLRIKHPEVLEIPLLKFEDEIQRHYGAQVVRGLRISPLIKHLAFCGFTYDMTISGSSNYKPDGVLLLLAPPADAGNLGAMQASVYVDGIGHRA